MVFKTVRGTTEKTNDNSTTSQYKLGKVVSEILEQGGNKQLYEARELQKNIGKVEDTANDINSEVVMASKLKTELKNLKELVSLVEVLQHVAAQTPEKIRDTYTRIGTLVTDEAVKKLYEAGKKPQDLPTSKEYHAEPRLYINTYLEFIEANHPGEKDILEKLKFDINKNTPAKYSNKLINKIEKESMENINKRMNEHLGDLKKMEQKDAANFAGLSKLMEEHVNSLGLTDEKLIGRALVINKPEYIKKFWEQIRVKAAEAGKIANADTEKDPEYLKYAAYAQLMNDPAMSKLIADTLIGQDGKSGLAAQLDNIVETYPRKGLKKQIIAFRKSMLKTINSEEFGVLTGFSVEGILGYSLKRRIKKTPSILGYSLKLGRKMNSRSGKTLENKYDEFVRDHAKLFTEKDKDGYTKFQKVSAEIIAYGAAMTALSNVIGTSSKGRTPYDKLKRERQGYVDALKDNANGGKVFNEYLTELRDAKIMAPSTISLNTLGYSNASKVLSNAKSIDISGLTDAEKNEFKKSIDADSPSAYDALSVIKYGNKAQLLKYEKLLPSKGRNSTKENIKKQFDNVDFDESDAPEKLEKARISMLIEMLLNNGSKSKAVNPATKKKLLADYAKDFEGYTPMDWIAANGELKKECDAQNKGIKFL